jgi:hypothetical protein
MENFIKDTYFDSDNFGFDGYTNQRQISQTSSARRRTNTKTRTPKKLVPMAINVDSYGFEGEEFDAYRGKRKAARIERKAARNTARIERKATRTAAKVERKANRPRVMKIRAKIADQEARTKAELEQNKADAQAERESANIDASAENKDQVLDFVPPTPEQQVKVKKYLERRGRTEIEQSPEMLSAQFREERGREINERLNDKVAYLDENAQANDQEWYDENYPTYEDVEEEILTEEEDSYAFTGDSDNFLDPDTIAVATNVGKKAADVYRQKRFAAGKKAFGMTKAQFDKKQEEQRKALAEGTDTISQLRGAAVQESTRQYIGRNPALIAVGVLVLVGAIYGLMQLNKK